jgi:alpha-glucosidase
MAPPASNYREHTMKMRIWLQYLSALLLAFIMPVKVPGAVDEQILSSPDGRLMLKFQWVKEGGLSYSLAADSRTLITPSALGMALGTNVFAPGPGWSLESSFRVSSNSVWKPVWGKRAVVPDRFNELTLNLVGPTSAPLRSLQVVARAYDDGVAFRYVVPASESGSAIAIRELTRYQFAGDYTAWFYNGEHHNLGPERLSESSGTRLPVMTIKVDADCYLAVHEADLVTGAPLVLRSDKGDTAFSVASEPGRLEPGYRSAWRVILCGRTPGALVDSHLIELLNPPAPAASDFSWVKPGLAVWDWRINGAKTADFSYAMDFPSWKRMVDFAAEAGIRYLQLDADWYGPEFKKESDPTKGDKAAQVRELIAYARPRNVGILLYLNDVGGRQYPLEEILANYQRWGASGIKYGFMRGSPAEKLARTKLITELCARHQLLCNFHDGPVHPFGQMRTWPNAVTREYCHSQLDAKRVFQPRTFVTSVFVNMLAGPLDMDNGMFDLRQGKTDRVDNNLETPSTVVSEAARTLIVFSGLTILPDIPEQYRRHPELLEFIAAQKQPWAESRTLAGEIGEYIVMMRQTGDTYLVGAAANESGRELDVALDFLAEGLFEATIVQDGPGAHYLTNRETSVIERRSVRRTERLHLKLAPGGGACLIFRPAAR